MILQTIENLIEHNRKTIMLYLLLSVGGFLLFDFILPALGVGQYAGKLSFATIIPIIFLPSQLRHKGEFFSHSSVALTSRQLFISKTIFDILCMIIIAAMLMLETIIGRTLLNIADYVFSLVMALVALQVTEIWNNFDNIFLKLKLNIKKIISVLISLSLLIIYIYGMSLIDENTLFDGLIASKGCQVGIYNCLFILILFSIDYYSFMRRKEY